MIRRQCLELYTLAQGLYKDTFLFEERIKEL